MSTEFCESVRVNKLRTDLIATSRQARAVCSLWRSGVGEVPTKAGSPLDNALTALTAINEFNAKHPAEAIDREELL